MSVPDPGLLPRTLARSESLRGELAVRVRESTAGPVYELIVGGVFAMDTVDISTEVALAQRTLARHASPRRVLVGGLGLGHTAAAVLADPRVELAVVAEIETDLVAWAREGLVPPLSDLAADPRAQLRASDVRAFLHQGAGYDAILLDVDNGPSFLVHQSNSGLYSPDGLRRATAALADSGILAIWAAQREGELLSHLHALSAELRVDVREEVVPIEREGRAFEYAIYFAERR